MTVQALKARNCEEFNQYAEAIARLQRFEISAASYLGRWPRLLNVGPLALNVSGRGPTKQDVGAPKARNVTAWGNAPGQRPL